MTYILIAYLRLYLECRSRLKSSSAELVLLQKLNFKIILIRYHEKLRFEELFFIYNDNVVVVRIVVSMNDMKFSFESIMFCPQSPSNIQKYSVMFFCGECKCTCCGVNVFS